MTQPQEPGPPDHCAAGRGADPASSADRASDDTGRTDEPRRISRRSLMVGGVLGLGAVVAAGAVALPHLPFSLRHRLGLTADPAIPDVPAGRVTLEQVYSHARNKTVDLFTAVPAGYGDGAGLPVVVVLHGATGRPDQYAGFGLPQFLTAAVQAGTPPFALAGADGGTLFWSPQPDGDDPGAMVLDEMPRWLAARGFDAATRALWGWSMGGYGVLNLSEQQPGWARATAAFSPAVSEGDQVFASSSRLRPRDLGIWCGTDDPLYPSVRALADSLRPAPAIASFSPGGHTRVYWNDQTAAAFAFLGGRLAG